MFNLARFAREAQLSRVVALELHELSYDIAREAIRQADPKADATEVERPLHRRLEFARAE
jgi:hypothetical protein